MSRLDYPAIRQRIPIRCVLLLLRYEPSHRNGRQWRGPCPLPGCGLLDGMSPDRPFSVDVGRHLFQCFRCQRAGNQLDLWTHVTGLKIYPATVDLCRRLSITPVILSNPQPPNRS